MSITSHKVISRCDHQNTASSSPAAAIPKHHPFRGLTSRDILSTVKIYIMELVHANDTTYQNLDTFHTAEVFSRPYNYPKLPDFLDIIMYGMNCSPFCFVYALIYIEKLQKSGALFLTSQCAHSLILTAAVISAKYLDDHYYFNSHYSYLACIPYQDLNKMELQFLFLLHYNLYMSNTSCERFFVTIRERVNPLSPESNIQVTENKNDPDRKDDRNIKALNDADKEIVTISYSDNDGDVLFFNKNRSRKQPSAQLNVHSKAFIPTDRRKKEEEKAQREREARELNIMRCEDHDIYHYIPAPTHRRPLLQLQPIPLQYDQPVLFDPGLYGTSFMSYNPNCGYPLSPVHQYNPTSSQSPKQPLFIPAKPSTIRVAQNPTFSGSFQSYQQSSLKDNHVPSQSPPLVLSSTPFSHNPSPTPTQTSQPSITIIPPSQPRSDSTGRHEPQSIKVPPTITFRPSTQADVVVLQTNENGIETKKVVLKENKSLPQIEPPKNMLKLDWKVALQPMHSVPLKEPEPQPRSIELKTTISTKGTLPPLLSTPPSFGKIPISQERAMNERNSLFYPVGVEPQDMQNMMKDDDPMSDDESEGGLVISDTDWSDSGEDKAHFGDQFNTYSDPMSSHSQPLFIPSQPQTLVFRPTAVQPVTVTTVDTSVTLRIMEEEPTERKEKKRSVFDDDENDFPSLPTPVQIIVCPVIPRKEKEHPEPNPSLHEIRPPQIEQNRNDSENPPTKLPSWPEKEQTSTSPLLSPSQAKLRYHSPSPCLSNPPPVSTASSHLSVHHTPLLPAPPSTRPLQGIVRTGSAANGLLNPIGHF
ncbi:putative Cyclin [Blattamonas nauphoetae]|uniref:Cyclin n=1 Tax=Blattamonas nauphoetae TaxID=2049346 RepID=A0ABQ9XM26_9EUKA|nr:putative Cyclin [Blattamonas nauphoetae]